MERQIKELNVSRIVYSRVSCTLIPCLDTFFFFLNPHIIFHVNTNFASLQTAVTQDSFCLDTQTSIDTFVFSVWDLELGGSQRSQTTACRCSLTAGYSPGLMGMIVLHNYRSCRPSLLLGAACNFPCTLTQSQRTWGHFSLAPYCNSSTWVYK